MITILKRNGVISPLTVQALQMAMEKVFGEINCLKIEIINSSNLKERREKLIQYRKKEGEKGLIKQLFIKNLKLISTYVQINTLYISPYIQKFLKNIFKNNNSTEPDIHL